MRLESRTRTRLLPALMVLFGMVALLVSACGPTSSSGAGKAASQVLHLAWAGGGSTDIASLDPGQVSDSGSIPIVDMVFDGLVVLDKNLKVVNWAADKVTQSSDGLTYTFHLRSGQSFSDGTPVKASDYAYAINRSDSPCLASPVNYYLWAIKDAATFANETCTNGTIAGSVQNLNNSVVADDGANTLTITLAQPAGYFLDAMTYSTSYALEQSVVSGSNLGADDKWTDNLATGTSGQGGSGMFYVSKWDHQGNLILKANPHWWGVSQGRKLSLTEVDFKVFASLDTLYSTYLSSSSYDYAGQNIPPAQIAAAKSRPDFYSPPYLGVGTVDFNWDIKPFDNLDARTAFCEAINRDLIMSAVYHEANTPSWHLVPKGMPGYNPSVKGPDGETATTADITNAQKHWQAYLASVGNKVPPIKYSYNTSSASASAYAQALIAGWNQVLPGANVQTDTTDWKTILKEEQQKHVQAYRSGWIADYPDPQDFLTLLYTTTSSYNWNNASVPQADQVMAQADAISDPSKQAQRMQLYNQAEQLLINQGATCPVYQYGNQYMLRSYVKGFTEDAQGQEATTEWPNAYIATH